MIRFIMQWQEVLEIMKNAAFTPIIEPVRSMGGLIGGEAKKIASRYHSGIGICGDLVRKMYDLCDGGLLRRIHPWG